MGRSPRAWALAPLLAAAAVLAAPCDCPDHGGSHGGVVAAAPAGHEHRVAAGARHATSHPTTASARPPADHADHGRGARAAAAFEVGTAARPLVIRGARGPLWSTSKPSVPGTGPHGTPAQQTVARQLERLREPGAAARAAVDPVATRTVLTTAQATKQLSKRCQRLIKRSRSRLSRSERRGRLACVRLRRAIVREANAPAPGVTAPAAPIQGPTPTAAPPATTEPTPTGPTSTTPDPAPTTPTAPAKKYAAAGVIAVDGDVPFQLTRASATADIVNFELDNTDRQDHNLFIAPANASGEITGAPVQVIGRIAGGERMSADVELAPGVYRLICTVPGHGPMSVKFTVYAPPAA